MQETPLDEASLKLLRRSQRTLKGIVLTTLPDGTCSASFDTFEARGATRFEAFQSRRTDQGPTLMTCTWCNDTKTMAWDSDERGCPPPPVEWDPNEEWGLMEASQHFNDQILLGSEPLTCTIACPVCIGFGRAKYPPFDIAEDMLDREQPPGLGFESSPESRWDRMYTHLLACRERDASLRWAEADRRLALARQQWLKVALQRAQHRIDNMPNWPVAPDEVLNDRRCPACTATDLTLTRHPRTRQSAVFCVECGAAWIYPNQPAHVAEQLRWRPNEVDNLHYTLEHVFLLSPGEIEALTVRYEFDLLQRLAGSSPKIRDL